MELIWAAALTAASGVLLAVSLVRYRSLKKSSDDQHRLLAERVSTYCREDYHADSTCDICFDSIGEEKVAVCTCGKTYHVSCAEPTGSCPYCGEDYANFHIRDARRVTCPLCGREMVNDVCECGLVMPDSRGHFKCRCGNDLKITDTRCSVCGCEFTREIHTVGKEFIPHRE